MSECIKLLQSDSTLPIQRARMRVKVTMPSDDGKRIRERIMEGAEKVEADDMGEQQWEVVSTVSKPQYSRAYCSWGYPTAGDAY